MSSPARPRAVPPSLPTGDADSLDGARRLDLPPRWPAVVRVELETRHRRMMAIATAHCDTATVLDLGSVEHRQILRNAVDHGLDSKHMGRFDAVVSAAGLARIADLGAALVVATRLLSPTGVLMAVEPGFRPGPMALMASSVGALVPAARGVHLARDLPATVRSAGLTVTDVERFTMPTLMWPLRPFVELRAVRRDGAVPEVRR